MPKVIIITNVDLEGYYNLTMEYLDAKYHRFPTNFQDFPISDEVAGQINSINAWTNEMIENHPVSPDGRFIWTGSEWEYIGKAVL